MSVQLSSDPVDVIKLPKGKRTPRWPVGTFGEAQTTELNKEETESANARKKTTARKTSKRKSSQSPQKVKKKKTTPPIHEQGTPRNYTHNAKRRIKRDRTVKLEIKEQAATMDMIGNTKGKPVGNIEELTKTVKVGPNETVNLEEELIDLNSFPKEYNEFMEAELAETLNLRELIDLNRSPQGFS